MEQKKADEILKKKKGPFGSLAMRVLSISFAFIVFPLILYAAVLYTGDYRQRLEEIFIDLRILEQDQMAYLEQFEKYSLNILHLIDEISQSVGSEKGVLYGSKFNEILTSYANSQGMNGINYLELKQDGRLICEASTNRNYVHQDFSKQIDLKEKEHLNDQIFIAEDPIFGWSLFFFRFVYTNSGELKGAVASAISLESLVNILAKDRGWKNAAISILGKGMYVYASSVKGLAGVNFYWGEKDSAPHQVTLDAVKDTYNGFEFSLDQKKNFAVIARIVDTNVYLMISIPSVYLLHQIFEYIARLAIFLLFIVVVGGITSYLFTLRMARPMKVLSSVMTEVGEGHFDKKYQKDRFGFEINFLGSKFNSMTEALTNYIQKAKREEAAKEVYAKELQIAHEIQKSILPEASISLPEVEIETYFQAAKEVAGDFYDWLDREDRIMVTIADGVGKGVSSSLYSFGLRSILRSFSMVEKDLKKLVLETNEMFRRDTKETYNFVTAFVTIFDKKSKILKYANCGHLPTLIKRKDQVCEKIVTKGIAFGVEELKEVEEKEVQLNSGEFVIFYTDGVTEAQDKEEHFYKEERLVKLVEETNVTNAKEMVKVIVDDLQDFTKGADQSDDITLVVMKVN